MDLPLVPVAKICACATMEAVIKIHELLDAMDPTREKESYKQLKRAVTALSEHMKEHDALNEQFRRNVFEATKFQSINMVPNGQEPLQSSAYKAGDVKRVREPPKKKNKKAAKQ